MFFCYVLRRVALVLEFQSARTTSQCSFQVLEEYVALHTFPASHLSSTESASIFIFRKVKRSVVLCCLQRSHSGQTGCSVAVKVHQAARKWTKPVQRIERISKLIEDKKFCKNKPKIKNLQFMSRSPVINSCIETPECSSYSPMCSLIMWLIVELLSFLKVGHLYYITKLYI